MIYVTPSRRWNLVVAEGRYQDFHKRTIQFLREFKNEPASDATQLRVPVAPVPVQRQEVTVSQLPEEAMEQSVQEATQVVEALMQVIASSCLNEIDTEASDYGATIQKCEDEKRKLAEQLADLETIFDKQCIESQRKLLDSETARDNATAELVVKEMELSGCQHQISVEQQNS